jgi:hypothetical protein
MPRPSKGYRGRPGCWADTPTDLRPGRRLAGSGRGCPTALADGTRPLSRAAARREVLRLAEAVLPENYLTPDLMQPFVRSGDATHPLSE